MHSVEEIREEIEQIEAWLASNVIDKTDFDRRMQHLLPELERALEIRREAQAAVAAEMAAREAAMLADNEAARASAAAQEPVDDITARSMKSIKELAQATSVSAKHKINAAVTKATSPQSKGETALKVQNEKLTARELVNGLGGLGLLAVGGYYLISSIFGGASVDADVKSRTEVARAPAVETVDESEKTASTTVGGDPSLAFSVNGKVAAIKGITLGADASVCPSGVDTAVYASGSGLDKKKMQVCNIDDGKDRTTVFFDATGTKVVAVERRLFVLHTEFDVDALMSKTKSFYGAPTFVKEDWTFGYGDAFSKDKRGMWRDDEKGKGLIVETEFCGMGGEDEECRRVPDTTMTITMKMVDLEAFQAAREAGRKLVEDEITSRATDVQL